MPLSHRANRVTTTDDDNDTTATQSPHNNITSSQRKTIKNRKRTRLCQRLFPQNTPGRKHILLLTLTFSTIILLPLSIIQLFFREYSWVSRRCLLSRLLPTLHKRMECIEAFVHQQALMDDRLLWPVNPFRTFSVDHIKGFQTRRKKIQEEGSGEVVKDVHFTLTSYFTDDNTLDLAKCSVETASRHCAKMGQYNLEPCKIHVWIVAEAAEMYYNRTNEDEVMAPEDDVNSTVYQLLSSLQSPDNQNNDKNDEYAPYCIRVVHPQNGFTRRHIGTACPPSSVSPPTQSHKMLKWLSSSLSHNQISAHMSDAWRIVALTEVGGLYLDLDVVLVSDMILYVQEKNVIPVQARVGAYRMNGGLLKLNNGGVSFTRNEKEEKKDGATSWFGSFFHGTAPPKTFLSALEQDHLYWAPKLASQPKDNIYQKFGYLGPCALTRTFLSHDKNDEDFLVLPEGVAEPSIHKSSFFCNLVDRDDVWALHFSRNRKKEWKDIVGVLRSKNRRGCLWDIFEGACPRSMESLS